MKKKAIKHLSLNLNNYLRSRYTADTVKAYEREIMIFLGNVPGAEKAVYNDLVNYLGSLRQRYSNGNTINRVLAGIKVYYDFLNHIGQRKDNPARSIRLRDKRSSDIQLQDLFSTEELEGLLNRKERYNNLILRNKALMSLLIYQALHPKEIEALTMADINLEQGSIYIRATPKTNSRELALKPPQIMLFYRYIYESRKHLLENKGADSVVFLVGQRGERMKAEDITKHIQRSCKGLFKGRRVNARTIRQSVICNLLKAGNDLRLVQTFAGHKYPSTTEMYKQNDVEVLQSAINRFHPMQ